MVVQGKFVKYADNIYVGGSDRASFLDNFEEVCNRLSNSNLRVNLTFQKDGTHENFRVFREISGNFRMS